METIQITDSQVSSDPQATRAAMPPQVKLMPKILQNNGRPVRPIPLLDAMGRDQGVIAYNATLAAGYTRETVGAFE